MKIAKKYIILGIVDIVCLFAFAYSRGVFKAPDAVHVYHILCDDFFLIGVLNMAVGLFMWVSNEGTFDLINYGMRRFWGFFFKDLNTYADFTDYKESKEGRKVYFLNFVLYGALFIAIAYVFLKLYQQY